MGPQHPILFTTPQLFLIEFFVIVPQLFLRNNYFLFSLFLSPMVPFAFSADFAVQSLSLMFSFVLLSFHFVTFVLKLFP